MVERQIPTDFYREPAAPRLGETLRPGGLVLTKRALDFCAFPAGAALLDIGCGAGATLRLARAAGCDCLGVDHSDAMLAAAREAGLGTWVQGADTAALPFGDAAFAGIFLECGLSAMGTHGPVLAEAWRVLRPGGRLILSDLFAPSAGEEGPLPLGIDWAAHGFAPLLREDHTPTLGDFYAQMVFELGSRAASEAFVGGCGAAEAKQLHYLLWVLEKRP